MSDQRHLTISISTLTMIKVVVVFLGLAFVYAVRDVIGLVLVSFVLASALTPTVDWMDRKFKIPRVFGLIIVFVLLFGIVALCFALLIPRVVTEVGDIANNFPQYLSKVQGEIGNIKDFKLTTSFFSNVSSSLQNLRASIGQTTSGIFSAIASIFGGIFAFIGIVVITFYLIVNETPMRKFLQSVVPKKILPTVSHIIDSIQHTLGYWLRGQAILSLTIFVVSFIGLSILGVKNAIVLALFAGLAEFVPFIGSTIGAVPAVFFGFAHSAWQGVAVIILYVIVQQLENNILVPKVMQKSVGLNPLVTIIAMFIGAKIAGIVGVLLAVPVVLIIRIVYKHLAPLYYGEFEKTDEVDEIDLKKA